MPLRQEAGVLGEQAEEDPVEQVRDGFRVVAAGAEALGDLGEMLRRLLGDLRGLDPWAEFFGRDEDVAEHG